MAYCWLSTVWVLTSTDWDEVGDCYYRCSEGISSTYPLRNPNLGNGTNDVAGRGARDTMFIEGNVRRVSDVNIWTQPDTAQEAGNSVLKYHEQGMAKA